VLDPDPINRGARGPDRRFGAAFLARPRRKCDQLKLRRRNDRPFAEE
jgi:hypothetical protein